MPEHAAEPDLLGRILDREKEALAFADFYLRQMRLVYTRVGNLKE